MGETASLLGAGQSNGRTLYIAQVSGQRILIGELRILKRAGTPHKIDLIDSKNTCGWIAIVAECGGPSLCCRANALQFETLTTFYYCISAPNKEDAILKSTLRL